MLLLENGEYDSTSEEEGEALADFGRFGDVHEKGQGEEAHEDGFCDPEAGPILVCTPTVLSVQAKPTHE